MVLQSRMKICIQSKSCLCLLKTQFEGMANIKIYLSDVASKDVKNVTFAFPILLQFYFMV